MNNLLKFPDKERYVLRDCQCCGSSMQFPVDLESKWGNNDFLCYVCFLWEQVVVAKYECMRH